MANKKQLEILKQGAEVWNKWREKKRGHIDLEDADLNNTNLRNVNLMYLNLRNVNLTYADLTNSNLSMSILSNTNFSNANLSYTDISKAYISKVILTKTNLTGATLFDSNIIETHFLETILFQTNFSMVKLERVNFSDCLMGKTIFGLTDLNNVQGLETTRVTSDCTIDFQTLRNSKNIPKEFLLKIGLPEIYINYLPDFYNVSPLRLFPVFLSHSWANKDFAGKLYEALINKGVLVWYDEKKLRAGDKIFEGLTKAISVYDKMILVCSKESLEESWWVDEEMNRIFKKERMYLKEKKKNVSLLIPITIDDHIFKWDGTKGESIRDKVIGDFSEWKDDTKFEIALNQLIEALNVDRGEENITSFL